MTISQGVAGLLFCGMIGWILFELGRRWDNYNPDDEPRML